MSLALVSECAVVGDNTSTIGGVVVDPDGNPVGHDLTRQIGSSYRLPKGYIDLALDAVVGQTFHGFSDDLAIDQFRALPLALAITPSEVFVHGHGAAKCDVHRMKLIMRRGSGAKQR
jgi:hypothetical protein